MYVIPASPLAKIFQTRKFKDKNGNWTSLQKKCIEDPSFLTDDKPFDIYVDRPSGGLKFTYNVPKDLKDVHGSKEMDIVNWLTGGANGEMSSETDHYGIVQFNTGFDSMQIMNRITEIQMLKETASEEQQAEFEREQEHLQTQAASKLKSSVVTARKQSDEKIKRILRVMFNNMKMQAQHNNDAGKPAPTPSDSEYLGIQVLEKELGAMTKDATERREKVAQIMNAINV